MSGSLRKPLKVVALAGGVGGARLVDGLDRAFLVLLLLTGASGLMLLALRHQAVMGVLLIVHLGIVLALFLTLPYGKLVHGLYRAAALLRYARESQ